MGTNTFFTFTRNTPQVREYQFIVDDGNEPNVTYLFSEFSLPWAGAQKFCQSRGGWLAEIKSDEENTNVLGWDIPDNRERWLGGKMAEFSTGWRWTQSNRSLEQGFTNWDDEEPPHRQPSRVKKVAFLWVFFIFFVFVFCFLLFFFFTTFVLILTVFLLYQTMR